MRRLPPLLWSSPLAWLLVFSALAFWAGGSARAQVTLDLRALDALPRAAPAAPPPARRRRSAPSRRVRPTLAEARARAVPAPGRGVPAPSAAATPLAAAPAAPLAAPPRLASAAPPPPVGIGAARPPRPGASGANAAARGPLTLAFARDQAFLTPGEIRAIGRLVRARRSADSVTYSVLAYAPASPQNPSAARRLALARALAVHDALRAAGVPGTRILLRAMGPPSGPAGASADRAELHVSLPGTTP